MKACESSLTGKEANVVSMLMEATNVETMQNQICKVPCEKELPSLGDWVDEKFETDKYASFMRMKKRAVQEEMRNKPKFDKWMREMEAGGDLPPGLAALNRGAKME